TITFHMALAMLLVCLLVFVGWRARRDPWRMEFRRGGSWLVALGATLFVLTVFEGVMGSQVREITDELARSHPGERRSQWVGELEETWVYVIHRSFSWLVLASAAGL